MKFREHAPFGSLADSLKTFVEMDPDRESLLAHLRVRWKGWLHLMPPLETVKVVPYIEGHKMPDPRIGWDDTFLVVLEGYGVMGYTDELPA